MSISSTIDRPQPRVQGSRRPTLNHYVNKAEITRSVVTGGPVTALCGATYVVTAHGGGRTDAPTAAVCDTCASIYSGLL